MQDLSPDDLASFHRQGFYRVDAFFGEAECDSLTAALDDLARSQPNSKSLIAHPVFQNLIASAPVLKIVRALLGPDVLFHHANGLRFASGCSPRAWHHDYDGDVAWRPGRPAMIHLMCYPEGLSAESGPLSLLPGSQYAAVARSAPARFGTDFLPGEHEVVGSRGLVVAIHSALWHCRRAQSSPRSRPYFNLSYCQPGAVRPERRTLARALEHLGAHDSPTIKSLARLGAGID